VKRTVTIEIAGATYRLTTDADEAHLQRLADAVNQRVDALGPKAARSASAAQLLAVVALGLAEDLEEAERRRASLLDGTRRTVKAAIERIDQRLAADAALATGANEAED